MKTFSFHTAYTQARELYGLELNPDEFESLGLIAWGKIGNKMSKLYKYQVVPDQSVNGEYIIPLPCNVDRIEAVTADYEDYQKTTPTTLAGNNQNGWIEGYIETRKFNTGTLNVSGKYIKYREEGVTDNKLIIKAMNLDKNNKNSKDSIAAAVMANKAKDRESIDRYQKDLEKVVKPEKAQKITDNAKKIGVILLFKANKLINFIIIAKANLKLI